jgi:hypothetical protein
MLSAIYILFMLSVITVSAMVPCKVIYVKIKHTIDLKFKSELTQPYVHEL